MDGLGGMIRHGMWRTGLALSLLMLWSGVANAATGPQVSTAEFVEAVFNPGRPSMRVLSLDANQREQAQAVRGLPFDRTKVLYWTDGERTAWVLNEIGKTKPITIGIVVRNQTIESVQVLAFRESRGGEVRYGFFTDQFSGLSLQMDRRLSGTVDGITGATLSVRAVKTAARLALWLDAQASGVSIARAS